MQPPKTEPVDPETLPDLARAVMREAKFPFLASIDGEQPRLRPVSPVRTEGFTVFVANLKAYHKTQEIAANPRVEGGYLAPNHDQVRITGKAIVETNQERLAAIWNENPLLRRYLGSPENPSWMVYQIEPERVRFMREWALEHWEVPIETGSGRIDAPR